MPELYILMFFMIGGAIIAIELRDLLSAVVAIGAVGLSISVAFLILKAPDLAITQLVVEILCLVILVRATLKRDTIESRGKSALFTAVGALACMGIILCFAYAPLQQLPSFGQPLLRVSETYLRDGLLQTGAANLVGAVYLDYRAYDTLGEATVLFTAVIGVLAVMRRYGKKRRDESCGEER
jgi:multisubunit Na+/H+ antiporter MnhB subunit